MIGRGGTRVACMYSCQNGTTTWGLHETPGTDTVMLHERREYSHQPRCNTANRSSNEVCGKKGGPMSIRTNFSSNVDHTKTQPPHSTSRTYILLTMMLARRSVLKTAQTATRAFSSGPVALPDLAFDYAALEPTVSVSAEIINSDHGDSPLKAV